MPKHAIFFLGVLSFLFGIVCASLGLSLPFAFIPAAIIFAAFYVSGTDARVAVAAGLLLLIGSAYYLWDDHRYQNQIAAVPASGIIRGVISEDPKNGADFETFYFKTEYGKIFVETKPAAYAYGDVIIARGTIEQPTAKYFGRHIVGIMRNPSIEISGTGAGNPIFAQLFRVKNTIREKLQSLLPGDRGALLFGIIFGDSANFSKPLQNDLAASGLRFITAIDGLHMQIVIMILFIALAYFLPRRIAYFFIFLFVIGFIALTGFSIAGLRASCMAGIAGLAKGTRRIYLLYNSLALCALVLVLINPKSIIFDVGFQLSFIAVLAIAYFMPVLRAPLHNFFGDVGDDGVLGWKQSLLITISVQLATAPIVITQFQSLSVTSFIASVLVVMMLPYVISFGFGLALLAFIFKPLAILLSFAVGPLIEYVLVVIHLFARVAIVFNPTIGFTEIVLYYGALVLAMYWFYTFRGTTTLAPKQAPAVTSTLGAADFEIIEIQ